MGEGRSDRNLYAHGGAARRRNQGGDRGSAPTLGSKCRDLPGRPGEARAVGTGEGRGGHGQGGRAWAGRRRSRATKFWNPEKGFWNPEKGYKPFFDFSLYREIF